MRALDAKGIMNLLLEARGTELETPVAVAVGTGLRRGELLGLR
jgi:integrase